MKDGRASGDPGKGARLGWSLRERGKFNGLRRTTPQRREGRERCPAAWPGGSKCHPGHATGLSQPIVNLFYYGLAMCQAPFRKPSPLVSPGAASCLKV